MPQAAGYGYGGGAQELLDGEHLRLLRIGYFISAGQTAIFIPVGLIYAGMGVMMSQLPTSAAPPPAFMSWLFGVIGAAFTGFAVLATTLKFLTAMRLKERRSRMLCLITASLSCLEIPYGTALGVMTFIVLGRDSVRQEVRRDLSRSYERRRKSRVSCCCPAARFALVCRRSSAKTLR